MNNQLEFLCNLYMEISGRTEDEEAIHALCAYAMLVNPQNPQGAWSLVKMAMLRLWGEGCWDEGNVYMFATHHGYWPDFQ